MESRVDKELLFSSIDDLHSRYKSREVSPVEVLETTLGRLEELEPKLNAFITVLPELAMEQAREAEALFSKGESKSKLTGVPVSIKDIFATEGIRTSMASRIMKEFVPDYDAYVYRALRNAGAVVFGKNNMLEFAYGFMHPDYGQCNNPWDTSRTAGGSSTGSAASVASGVGFASIGTDTGGSIRAPGSFCGIVGLKPTYERVSREGLFPLSHTLDHVGPLTRTVGDNALVLECVASSPFDSSLAVGDSISGMKVGVVRDLLDDESLTPEVSALVESAIERLRDLGAEIIDIDIPSIETASEIALPILLAEASYYHKQWYPARAGDYSSGTRANVAAGFDVTGVDYLEALGKRRRFTEVVSGAFDEIEILVCPTLPYPATQKDPEFGEATLDVVKRTIPFNVTGNPALTVPAGNTAQDNLPVGIQLIAAHHREDVAYRVAAAYERDVGGFENPPL